MLERLRKLPAWLWWLLAAGALVAVAAVFLFRAELPGAIAAAREWLELLIGRLEGLGPVPFYIGFAVLAVIGVPVSPFVLAGAAAFGKAVGFFGALGAFVVAASLAHGLARHCFRRLAEWLLKRAGLVVPEADPKNHRALAVVVRMTPGVPFVLQNNLLSLAGVPLWLNLAFMVPILSLHLLGFVFLGDAFAKGHLGKILLGVGLLVLASYVIVRLRTRHAQRQARPGSAT